MCTCLFLFHFNKRLVVVTVVGILPVISGNPSGILVAVVGKWVVAVGTSWMDLGKLAVVGKWVAAVDILSVNFGK